MMGESGDYLASCMQIKKGLRSMVERFVEVCRMRGLKTSASNEWRGGIGV